MKKLLTLILVLVPLVAAAQEGTITYDRAIKYEYEIPERLAGMKDMIPTQSTESMILVFNGVESLMTIAPAKKEEAPQDAMAARAKGLVVRLKMGSTSRSDQEDFLETYCNHEEGTFAETRDFMSRTFLLAGDQPTYAWKLSGEQSEFLGYPVQKATAVQDSTSIEAWFTAQIPLSGGPGLFGGLPGMILVVSVDDGRMVYSATDVNMDGLGGKEIVLPVKGQKVSSDEYESIVVEKLDELKALRASRSRDLR